LIDTFTSENKGSISIPTIINTQSILSLPEVKVYVSQNPEDYFLYPDSSPITSPIYTSGKPEEPSSSFPFPPHLDLLSSHDHFPELHSQHPEVVERSVDQSFEVFENLLFSPRVCLLDFQWSVLEVLVLEVSEVQGLVDKLNPLGYFPRSPARYAPLVLPVVLHDLPENYMKNLPKFMGEGDLTTT
jgi:hypothetical protein